MIRVGDKIGRFMLNRELGRGSNGVVYEATDSLLSTKVALKVLHPWLAGEPQVRERFKRELLLTRRVSHPGICRLFDLHEEKETVFITMEFVEGCTLSQLLKDQGLLHPPRAIRILRSTAQALFAAHGAGVIHRDLKPGNINVRPDDSVTILDFGIATATDVGRLTRPGQTVGSLRYIPPEVWEGQAATALGDIYALGVISYACLTGRLPYDAPGAVMMLEVLKTTKPTPIQEINPQVDPALADTVMKAMAIDPANRFASAQEFDQALESLEDPELRAALGAAPSASVEAFEPPTQQVAVAKATDDATKVIAPASLGSPAAAEKSPPAQPDHIPDHIPEMVPSSTLVVDAGMIVAQNKAEREPRDTSVQAAVVEHHGAPMLTMGEGKVSVDRQKASIAPMLDGALIDSALERVLGPSSSSAASTSLAEALEGQTRVDDSPFGPSGIVRPAMSGRSSGPHGKDMQVVRVSRSGEGAAKDTPTTGGMGKAPSSPSGEAANDVDNQAALDALRIPTDPQMDNAFDNAFVSPTTDPAKQSVTLPDRTMIAPAPSEPSGKVERTVVAKAWGTSAEGDGLDGPAEITDPGPADERRKAAAARTRMFAIAGVLGLLVVGGAIAFAMQGKKEDPVATKDPVAEGPKVDPPKPDEPPKPEEAKPDEPVKADEPAKPDEAKPDEPVKADEPPKPDEAKPDEAKPDEAQVAKPAGGDSWDLGPDDIGAKPDAKPDEEVKPPKGEKPPKLAKARSEDDEVKRPAPKAGGAKDKAAYTTALKSLDKAMKAKGLVPGDVPDLDAAASKGRALAAKGKHGDAADQMNQAVEVAEGAQITKGFVLKKLARFNKLYDKVETPTQKAKLTPISNDISAKLGSGDYQGANSLLNKAFGILAGRH